MLLLESVAMQLYRTYNAHRISIVPLSPPERVHLDVPANKAFRFEMLIAAKSGLYLYPDRQLAKWLPGSYSGISEKNGRWYVHKFEANTFGRLLSFQIVDDKICDLREELQAIPAEIHQIDWFGDHLLLTETQNNRITSYHKKPNGFGRPRHYCPAGRLRAERKLENYCHNNSIYCDNHNTFLLYHSDTKYSGRTSQIAILDHCFLLQGRIDIDADCAHNVVPYLDSFSYRNSMRGIVCISGKHITIGFYPRGLALTNDLAIVGLPKFGERSATNRSESNLNIICLNTGKILDSITIPNIGTLYEIRLVDSVDLGISYRRSRTAVRT